MHKGNQCHSVIFAAFPVDCCNGGEKNSKDHLMNINNLFIRLMFS